MPSTWKLSKLTDLKANKLYTEGIVLYIQAEVAQPAIVICHRGQTVIHVTLMSPNLIVKKQNLAYFVHLPGRENEEKKFRFRMFNTIECRDLHMYLSRYVTIINVESNSQQQPEVFSQNSSICLSQDVVSFDSLSQSNSFSQDSLDSFPSPYHEYPYYYEKEYSASLPIDFGNKSLIHNNVSFNSQPPTVNRVSHSIPDIHSTRNQVPCLMQSSPSVGSNLHDNPYASPFLQNSLESRYNPEAAVNKESNSTPIENPLKNDAKKFQDQAVQTDNSNVQEYESITDKHLINIIDVLKNDGSFQNFVSRVAEALNTLKEKEGCRPKHAIKRKINEISSPVSEENSGVFQRVERLIRDFK